MQRVQRQIDGKTLSQSFRDEKAVVYKLCGVEKVPNFPLGAEAIENALFN